MATRHPIEPLRDLTRLKINSISSYLLVGIATNNLGGASKMKLKMLLWRLKCHIANKLHIYTLQNDRDEWNGDKEHDLRVSIAYCVTLLKLSV